MLESLKLPSSEAHNNAEGRIHASLMYQISLVEIPTQNLYANGT